MGSHRTNGLEFGKIERILRSKNKKRHPKQKKKNWGQENYREEMSLTGISAKRKGPALGKSQR